MHQSDLNWKENITFDMLKNLTFDRLLSLGYFLFKFCFFTKKSWSISFESTITEIHFSFITFIITIQCATMQTLCTYVSHNCVVLNSVSCIGQDQLESIHSTFWIRFGIQGWNSLQLHHLYHSVPLCNNADTALCVLMLVAHPLLCCAEFDRSIALDRIN